MSIAMFRKRRALALLTSGLMAAMIWMPAQAQMVPPENTITTQGHGQVRIEPDSLSVTVTVESRAEELAAARTQNNRQMQAVINALKALRIPNMKLETQNVHVYPIQGERQKNRLPQVVGYQVSNTLRVQVIDARSDNLGDYGSRIVDTALDAGANNVGGLSFYLEDMSAPRAQALQLAVQDARRYAQAMAQAAGVTLNGVYSMEGSPSFGGYPRPMPMYAAKAESADMARTPVEVGEEVITSEVTVRFKF